MSTALRGLFYTIVLLLRNSTVIKRFANLLSAAQPILGKTASAIQPAVGMVHLPSKIAMAPVSREGIRIKPAMRGSEDVSGGAAKEALYDAYEARVADKGSGRTAEQVYLDESSIPEDTYKSKSAAFNNSAYSGSSGRDDDGDRGIKINPNADRVLLAHELGHHAAQQTDVGNFIANMRHSPQLSNAIVQSALMTVPALGLSALMPGDDDTAAAMALSAATMAPMILDEANATRHGLGIMKTANMRADLGQRGKLAGGLLSYIGMPLTMGALANVAGNQLDAEQTSGTVMP